MPIEGPVEGSEPYGTGALRVQRALAELRGGRSVVVRDPERPEASLGVVAVEPLVESALAGFDAQDGAAFHGNAGEVRLLLAGDRARALELDTRAEAVELRVDVSGHDSPAAADALASLAGCSAPPWSAAVRRVSGCTGASGAAVAALSLARQGGLIPALLLGPAATEGARIGVDVDDIEAYPERRGRLLARASSARVPLPGAGRCEFVVYRERYGDAEHVAVVIGAPRTDAPVTVRIHSACFTGDLFGSMKCDCGEQLRGAVSRMASEGGGIVLYLQQEGRGIGLANKLRAYALQERGHDTIDADRSLGFRADGRDFTAARTMLADLGVSRVRLVTNNPRKIAALEAGGIEIAERLPSLASVNAHNAFYLETKRDRAGHLLGPSGLAAVGK